MASSASSQAHVGRRILLTVLWTVLFVVGLALAVLLLVPDLASLVQQASVSTTAWKTVLVAASVALVLIGLWGISSSHRNLRHAVDLISEVDRARKETIQLETTRYLSKGK
jgi:quinol-cytochrome oxidoreductase complex cytochrome b subunit